MMQMILLRVRGCDGEDSNNPSAPFCWPGPNLELMTLVATHKHKIPLKLCKSNRYGQTATLGGELSTTGGYGCGINYLVHAPSALSIIKFLHLQIRKKKTQVLPAGMNFCRGRHAQGYITIWETNREVGNVEMLPGNKLDKIRSLGRNAVKIINIGLSR
jgi:hypothetical protein